MSSETTAGFSITTNIAYDNLIFIDIQSKGYYSITETKLNFVVDYDDMPNLEGQIVKLDLEATDGIKKINKSIELEFLSRGEEKESKEGDYVGGADDNAVETYKEEAIDELI